MDCYNSTAWTDPFLIEGILHLVSFFLLLQLNPNSSNTDSSITMVNSNSFLSLYETLPISQENIFREISYFIMKLYVNEAVLMSTHNISLLCRRSKRFP